MKKFLKRIKTYYSSHNALKLPKVLKILGGRQRIKDVRKKIVVIAVFIA